MEMDAETIASRAEATYNVDFRMYVNTIYEYPAWTVAAGVRCTLEEQRKSLYHEGWILGKKQSRSMKKSWKRYIAGWTEKGNQKHAEAD